MKKKLLALLLAALMVVGLLPSTVSASYNSTLEFKCGPTEIVVTDLSTQSSSKFKLAITQKAKHTGEYNKEVLYDNTVELILCPETHSLVGTFSTDDYTIDQNSFLKSGSSTRYVSNWETSTITIVSKGGNKYAITGGLLQVENSNGTALYKYNYCYNADDLNNQLAEQTPFEFTFGDDTIPVTAASYVEKYYASSLDWQVIMKDAAGNGFSFDIFAPAEGFENGKTYTSDNGDFDLEYTFAQVNKVNDAAVKASFTKTETEDALTVTAEMTTTGNKVYQFTYILDKTVEVVDDHGIIIQPAKGETKEYNRLATNTCFYYDYVTKLNYQSGTATLVECADGTVYWKDPISMYTKGTWIKGKKEGSTITFATKQPVFYNTSYKASMSVRWGNFDTKIFKVADDYADSFIFDIEGDSLIMRGTQATVGETAAYFPGIFWDDDNSFLGYGDCGVTLTVAKPTYAITNGTAQDANGSITVAETAAEGETVTISVNPATGYQLKTLKYNDGTTDYDITKDATSGNYQFTMPAKAVTVTAEFEAATPHYTTYENWQIKYGNAWEWSGNMDKVEDGLFKIEILWEGTGFNVKSDENPIKKDWFAPEELTIGEELSALVPVIVDVYLKVIDDETVKIGVGVIPEDPAPASYTYSVTFPKGPEQVYIIGNTSNWETFTPMTMTSDTTATITVDTQFIEYKYTAGADWAYVEKDAQGNEISNRTSYANPDIVGSWAAVPAPTHTHSFTYTANNGKITATCTAGCNKGYDTTPLTLTLTAPASLVYDGNAKAFTFADGEADAWTGAGLELPTIIYQIKQSGQSTYMPLLGTLKSVGDYMAQITVDEKTAQVYFSIEAPHTHNPVMVNGQAATLESAGFKSYYKCDCGNYFEDAEGKIVITDLSAWKAEGGAGYIAKLDSPQTGDTSNMTPWVMLMVFSFMGLCLVLVKKRKKVQ